jgi:plastocyanin
MRAHHILPLILSLVAVGGLGCSSSTEPMTVPSGDVSIKQDASTLGANAFSPDPFSESFAVKATVKWVNADVGTGGYGGSTGVSHHLVSNTLGVFDTGMIGPGSTQTVTFTAPGSYPYHCSIHPTMTGTITINP